MAIRLYMDFTLILCLANVCALSFESADEILIDGRPGWKSTRIDWAQNLIRIATEEGLCW